MVDGAKVGDFSYEGENIDMLIVRDPSVALTPSELAEIPLAVTEAGGRTRLSRSANWSSSSRPTPHSRSAGWSSGGR